MKKKITLVVAMMIALSMMLSVSSFAATVSDLKEWGAGTKVEVTGDSSPYQLKLTGDAVQDLVIESGEDVTLDLAGHKLTNFSDGQVHEGDEARSQCSTIWVKPGGKLTIKDTSNGKEGKIEQLEKSTCAPIANDGTLVIEGGTITGVTKENNIGVVVNNGDLTIKGGTITGDNECVQNFGTATISGGAIEEKGDFFAVRNEGTMTISEGATIESTSKKTSIVGNMKVKGTAEPSLTVNGATIKGETSGVVNYNGEANLTGVEKVHLNGGKVTVDENSKVTYGEGLVVKVGDTYYADNEASKDIVGETSATDIVEQLKEDGEAELTVIQGDLTVTGAAEGFTINKEGKGKVTVNGVEVIDSFTVPEKTEPEQAEEEKESEEEIVEDEKDDTRDTGVENVYAIAGLVVMVTLAGVAILNKRK